MQAAAPFNAFSLPYGPYILLSGSIPLVVRIWSMTSGKRQGISLNTISFVLGAPLFCYLPFFLFGCCCSSVGC